MPTTTTTAPAELFKARIAELVATNPEVKNRAVDALVAEITRTHAGDEHAQYLVFTHVLNKVDPYWRVKTTD